MKQLIKSPLNYTGGKYKLLPQILPLFPTNPRYFIDMFCGGVNVGANVSARTVIANDYMSQIIDLYKVWQSMSIEEVIAHIESRINQFGLTKQNQEGYLELRALYNSTKNPLDLYVLICYSFNHSIRFNSKGEFNIAFGKDRSEFNPNMKANLIKFLDGIKGIKFLNKSFETMDLSKLTEDDFLYADPPYLITVANYNENGGWNGELEVKLLDKLDEANSRGIKFALSNVLEHKGKSNDILKEWSKKYNVHYLNYDYSNSNYQTKDKTKGGSIEVLITNY